MSAMACSPERAWQIERIVKARDLVKPWCVLDVGYPDGRPDFLKLWCCDVETVDPYYDEATHTVAFEDFDESRVYDLVNLTSVLDYFDDPIAGLRKAREVGRWVLVQGRLNTYSHPQFNTKYWTPTKGWVLEKADDVLGMDDPEWVEFFGGQMFSIFGKVVR